MVSQSCLSWAVWSEQVFLRGDTEQKIEVEVIIAEVSGRVVQVQSAGTWGRC